MTRLGKILLYFNVALSITFAAWALGVFTNRIELGDKGATADQVAGEIFKRKEEIKRLTEGRNRADQRWLAARGELATSEKDRAGDRVFYAKELQDLETSQAPVKGVVYEKGRLKLDQTGRRPLLANLTDKTGQPVFSVSVLNKRYAQLQAEVDAEMRILDGLIKQEKELTHELTGDGMGKKGLRAELATELLERQNALFEQDYLEPLRYNREVEMRLLLKRQKQLKDRLQELKAVGITAKKL